MIYLLFLTGGTTIIFLIFYIWLTEKRHNSDILNQPDLIQSIRHNDTRLQSLLDTLPDYVLKFDSKLRLIYYNSPGQQLVDGAKLKLLDQTEDGFTLSKRLTRIWFQELLHVLKNGQASSFDFKATVDHETRFYEVNAVPDSQKLGDDVSVICVIRDVTNRKTVEEQRLKLALEQQRIADLSNVSDSIAHDIRTPLSSIGTSAYIVRKTTDAKKQEQQLENIEQNVKQIAKQIDNLLLMTQLDSNKPVTYARVNITSLIRQLSNVFEDIASAKSISFESEINEMGPIHAEYEYLHQALEHIFYNAINFTAPGGEIRIKAYKEQKSTYLEVTDSGCGMTKEQMSRIFERFYRCDPSRPRNMSTGGSGLGLSIARTIIERHGGAISVSSTVDVGSTFTIMLPLNITKIKPDSLPGKYLSRTAL